jgi:hypothetical protein
LLELAVRITSEISVAPIGTDNSAIRYQRSGTRHRRLRRVRSATPARPDNAAVTTKAASPAPSDMKTPCNGRPSGKIAESTIGGIATVTKPIPRLISMKATTGCRGTPRTEADAFITRRSQMEGRSRRCHRDRSVVLEALGTFSYFHQRVLDVFGRQTPALAIGDFNDEPAVSQGHLCAARATLSNLMWPIAGAPDGNFDNQPNMLGQFMVNKNMAPATPRPSSTQRRSYRHRSGHGQ